jgi:hypothetical protein
VVPGFPGSPGGKIKKTRRIVGRRSGVSVKRRGGVNSPFSWRLRCVGSPGSPGPLTMTMESATRRAKTQRHSCRPSPDLRSGNRFRDTHQPAARHFSIIQNWAANSTLVVQLFSNETRDKTTKTGSPRAVKLRPFEGSSRRGRSPAAVSRKGFSSGRGVTPKPGSHRSPKPLGPYGVPVAGGQQITKTSRVLNEGKVS